MLPRHQPHPGRNLAPIRERAGVADSGYQRRCGDRYHAQDCCSRCVTVLISTQRMCGCPTASQIALASLPLSSDRAPRELLVDQAHSIAQCPQLPRPIIVGALTSSPLKQDSPRLFFSIICCQHWVFPSLYN